MKRIGLSALLLMAVLLASCAEHPGGDSAVVPTGPGGLGRSGGGGLDLDDLLYEEFTGTLAEGVGGAMYEYATTWGRRRDLLFSVIVPQESMPTGIGSTTFTMEIPRGDMYDLYPDPYPEGLGDWIVLRMKPHNMQFIGPIRLQGTWMPWDTDGPPDPLIFHNGTDTVEATVVQLPNGLYRFWFEVDHFSDWEVGPPLD